MDYGFSRFDSERIDSSFRNLYPEQRDFSEEISFLFCDLNLKVGNLLDNGQVNSARIEARFTKSKVLARLRVAREFGIIHPRDYFPLARDFILQVNSLLGEVNSVIPLRI